MIPTYKLIKCFLAKHNFLLFWMLLLPPKISNLIKKNFNTKF